MIFAAELCEIFPHLAGTSSIIIAMWVKENIRQGSILAGSVDRDQEEKKIDGNQTALLVSITWTFCLLG